MTKMLNLYTLMTKEESEVFHKIESDKERDKHREKMKEKYFNPIYDSIDALHPEVKELLNKVSELSCSVSESLNEFGDCYVSEANKLFYDSRTLKELLNRGL